MFEAKVLLQKSLWKLSQEIVYFQFGKHPWLLKAVQFSWKSRLLRSPISRVLRATIFPHFCGGEDARASIMIANSLYRQYKITTILDYSCEDSLSEGKMEENGQDKLFLLQEFHRFYPDARDNPIKFLPLKCTSLLSFQVLEEISKKLQKSPALLDSITSPTHLSSHLPSSLQGPWIQGYHRIEKICKEAVEEQSLSILLDAEQSHRQPAVELLYRLLALRFNQKKSSPSTALVYNTYQCYLTRSPAAIQRDWLFSREHNLLFGVKLVRGAYMKSEAELSQRLAITSPIFASKHLTDQNYQSMTDYLLEQLQQSPSGLQLLFATHNRTSLHYAIKKMKSLQLPNDSSQIHFAQILGMTDNLTIGLAQAGYSVSKLILFGQFEELMPWMLRRLEENQVLDVISIRQCISLNLPL